MRSLRCPGWKLGLIAAQAALFAVCSARAEDAPTSAPADAQALEFFEKSVRPILAERCQSCHGPQKQKNGLRLDSRASALKGGLTGPAIEPGNPEESLLVEAIRYGDLYQMPPKSKLPESEIATLTRWVAMGAPWPAEATSASALVLKDRGFDLKARARHWSFQPLRVVEVPRMRNAAWPRTDIDRFLLAKVEEAGLTPAPDADRRTLIRRLTFDLIGLPPSPEEVRAFVADQSPDVYEKLVERLLASPHYGERWGRHWLDLVRFAETAGHEFDYDILGAYRYRDYVIRAFNADVPYRDFVIDHLAGDLLPEPRRHPAEGFNESILATGFFFLGEGTHSPVDLLEEEATRVDNQIDVLSKAFLGLTVACARCHDHKFDAISTRDYYALAGYLKSARYQHAFIDPPERIGGFVAKLEQLRDEISTILRRSVEDRKLPASDGRIATCLLAARKLLREPNAPESRCAEIAGEAGIRPAHLARWVSALRSEPARKPGHPLHAWAAIQADGSTIEGLRRQLRTSPQSARTPVVFEDFNGSSFDGWFVSGDAFGTAPTRAGDLRIGGSSEQPAVTLLAPGQAHSGRVSGRLQGVLRSRKFSIQQRYIHYRAWGRGGRIRLVIDGFEKIRDPIYGGLAIDVNETEGPRWYAQDVGMWLGHQAYIELADGAVSVYEGTRSSYASGEGFLALDEIRFADDAAPATEADPWTGLLLEDPQVDSPERLAEAYEQKIVQTLSDWSARRLTSSPDDGARLTAVGWLIEHGLLAAARTEDLAAKLASYRAIEAEIPPPTLALAMADGTGSDDRVHIRGSTRALGEIVPRRFLEAISGATQQAPGQGSGRLDLAQRLIGPANPLPARVMVNRIWQHHFGQGLVPTPDDFGAMGQPPSHPELLDWLAAQFQGHGWSIKHMHRLIVSSHAYQTASLPSTEAERIDPNNRLLHRTNIRRLEGEAIRDAMLAVSGRLDRTLFGPSVPVHLNPFMEGRGRPATSGPLDGYGRRSIYINVRRNFLNPMFLAFDFPTPASTMGRRNVSNVPAQALTLLNDPFVLEQASHWAERVLAVPGKSDSERLAILYETAFARLPTAEEEREALRFLGSRPQAWAELCHVLFNAKEFVFID